jgi:two-component system sensor histidine kinase DegS
VNRESPATAVGPPAGDLAARLTTELAGLAREMTEIEMLVAQAQTEAARHEQKRVQTAEKLESGVNLPPADVATLNTQLITLTRRAAVMEAQVDVLEGKRKTLGRLRDMLAELATTYGGLVPVEEGGGGVPRLGAGQAPGEGSPMSRIVLNAQEDLRRDIARAMHDGPAQSLTNIVLQAQIVERLLGRDLDGARTELHLLVSMVQQTLEATKSFIFDVRPMVLDDLGLVPTLRRAARERGRRAGISVEFDSVGQDHRIEVDVESSLFRIIDEALAAYLAGNPDRVSVRLDWSDELMIAVVSANRAPTDAMAAADRQVVEVHQETESTDKNLPPALETMMADRRDRAEAAAVAARDAAVVALSTATWREIQQRAITTGIVAELADGGGTLRLRVDLTASRDAATSGG